MTQATRATQAPGTLGGSDPCLSDSPVADQREASPAVQGGFPHDNATGRNMSRAELVQRIENGQYQNYHVRVISGTKTPVSNPDQSEGNNLG